VRARKPCARLVVSEDYHTMSNQHVFKLDRRIMTIRHGLALGAVAALSLMGFLASYHVATTEKNRAVLMNAAGTQGMLAQRIVTYALLVAQADTQKEREAARNALASAVDLLDRSHRTAVGADYESGSFAGHSSELNRFYFASPMKLDQHIKEFLVRARSIRDSGSETLGRDNTDLQYLIETADSSLAPGLEKVMAQCQEESKRAARTLLTLQTAIVIATLFVLVMEVLFVFRPMTATIGGERELLVRLSVELQELEATDGLTGVLNRSRFDEVIERELRMVNRYVTSLSVIVLDIDHFKQVNDRHGHHVGDRVLMAVSEIIQANLRNTDFVFRWGGEEFLVLLPRTNIEGAAGVAEKLRSLVAEKTFDDDLRVTISLGVAQLAEQEGADAFVKRADDALCNAKTAGRNAVCRALIPDV